MNQRILYFLLVEIKTGVNLDRLVLSEEVDLLHQLRRGRWQYLEYTPVLLFEGIVVIDALGPNDHQDQGAPHERNQRKYHFEVVTAVLERIGHSEVFHLL